MRCFCGLSISFIAEYRELRAQAEHQLMSPAGLSQIETVPYDMKLMLAF